MHIDTHTRQKASAEELEDYKINIWPHSISTLNTEKKMTPSFTR